MFILIIYSLIALVLLYLGAKYFVKSSVDIALFFHMKPYLISITVVAFATSMPELFTTCIAQLSSDSADIALGNVIGSNIANIGLVLGLTCLVKPITVLKTYASRDFFQLFLSSFLLAFFLLKGSITRFDALILFIAFLVFYAWQILKHKKDKLEKLHEVKSIWKDLILLVASLVALLFGAQLLILQAIYVANLYQISERIVGLSMVAIGTSIPELAVCLVAAFQNREEVSLGNIIGSNLFNTLFIVSMAAFIRPMVFSKAFFTIDLPVMLILTIVLWAMTFFRKFLARKEGAVLLILYACYLFILFF